MFKRLGIASVLALSALTLVPASAHADTPGCVTRAEYRQVTKGMTKTRVDGIFDLKGHREVVSYSGGYGSEIRSYKTCSLYSVVSMAFEKRPGGAWRLAAKSAVWTY